MSYRIGGLVSKFRMVPLSLSVINFFSQITSNADSHMYLQIDSFPILSIPTYEIFLTFPFTFSRYLSFLYELPRMDIYAKHTHLQEKQAER